MESSASPYRYFTNEEFKTKLISQICFCGYVLKKKQKHIQRGGKKKNSVRSSQAKIWHRRPC